MAFLLALLTLLPAIVDGSAIHWPDDNDSTMRIVQVRDLIAGQGWFDYSQYRMGLDGGFVMHWSRIVDLPIAAIILLTQAVTGSAEYGELAAGIVWPTILLAIAMLSIMRSARIMGGEDAVFPAALIALMSLYSIGVFAPGAFDHHNLQLTLCLLALWALLGEAGLRNGVVAGLLMALTLATGMETLPLVATAGLCVAAAFLLAGRSYAGPTIGFGAGFIAGCAAAFVAMVGWQNWLVAHCDAFSIAHLVVAAIGGGGLATVAAMSVANGNFRSRSISLISLSLVLSVVVVIAYPQCLTGPYSGLDQRLQTHWLSGIGEAQSVVSIWLNDPVSFAKYYATPLAALAVLIANLLHTGPKRRQLIVGGFLLISIIISFWQVRGGNFAVAMAVIPLAVWVGQKRAAAGTSHAATVAMIFAWVVSLNACWTLAAQALHKTAKPAQAAVADASAPAKTGQDCYQKSVLSPLAGMETGIVAAVSNIGPALLKHTPHRMLAGPYHRNIDGNIVNLDILMGFPDDAWQTVRANGVTIIAHCPDNDETGFLVASAPDGLLAALERNEPPVWLKPVANSGNSPLRIYNVKLN